MVQELFASYAWLGQAALVVACLGWVAVLLRTLLEPGGAAAARLPLDEAPERRKP